MKILILDDEAAAIAKAAELIEKQVSQVPASVLGPATGGTMVPLYECLRKSRDSKKIFVFRYFAHCRMSKMPTFCVECPNHVPFIDPKTWC